MRAPFALLALLVALLLAGCVPALDPYIERQDEAVLVTVTANQAVYAVTVTVLDARTQDARCAAVDGDTWCLLGDLEAGAVAVVEVFGPPGVACTAAGYLREDQHITTYRPFACKTR